MELKICFSISSSNPSNYSVTEQCLLESLLPICVCSAEMEVNADVWVKNNSYKDPIHDQLWTPCIVHEKANYSVIITEPCHDSGCL